MTVRSTARWMLVLVVLLLLGALGYGYALMMESDQLVRQAVLQRLEKIAPGWNFRIGRARFDWGRRVRLYDLTLLNAAGDTVLVRVPQAHLVIDIDRFRQYQEIDIQKVRLIQPQVELRQQLDGLWNFSGLTPPPKTTQSLPEFEVQQAGLSVVLERAAGQLPAELNLTAADLQLVPSGRREFLFIGQTHINGAGTLSFNGEWTPDDGLWSLEGAIREVTTTGELTALAASLSPEFRSRLIALDASIRKSVAERDQAESLPQVASNSTAIPFTPAGPSPASSSQATVVGIPDPGIEATFDVQFGASQQERGTEPEFHLSLQIRRGQITSPALPFPLHELQGQLFFDNQTLKLQGLSARNGVTRFSLDGTVDREQPSYSALVKAEIKSLVLDSRLRRQLTPGLGRLYDSLAPSGQVDLSLSVVRTVDGRWGYRDLRATAQDCSVAHSRFPLRVRKVEGTVQQRGQQLELDFRGFAGASPVSVKGTVTNPGPVARTELEIVARQLPLDESFRSACPPNLQKTFHSLQLRGMADGVFRLLIPETRPVQLITSLSASVREGAIEYENFPWRVTDLAGEVQFDSARGLWSFTRLTGRHAGARLAGNGSFRIHSGAPKGQLSLNVAAVDAPLDHSLRDALPEKLRQTWESLALEGTADLQTVIHWTSGRPPDVTVPEFVMHGGSLRLKSFPWLLENVAAQLSWSDGNATINSLTATHDETKVRARGLLETTPEGDWRLRLTDAFVDDLIPDREFRRALPGQLRDAVSTINPRGPVSLSGWVEFRGTDRPEDPVTAAWDIESVYSGAEVTAGIDLKNLHGRINTAGQYDGNEVQLEGKLDLDSVVLLDHQLTQVRGPFVLNGQRLTLGSSLALQPVQNENNPPQVPLRDRITARAIDGLITVDGAILLAEEPVYRVKATLSNGKLESYARRYHPTATDIRGVMNGWIDLHGRGNQASGASGHGKLQISPAALWELPVFVQLFNVLSLTPQDRTAFKYAYLEFQLFRQQFQFDLIDLVGDSMSLRGRGTAGLDGRLALDFYSEMPKNRISIPVFSFVVGEVSRGWVGVEVRGTTSDPKATFKTAPQLDNALRRFLSAFDPRPSQRTPLFVIPTLPSFSGNGQPAPRTGNR